MHAGTNNPDCLKRSASRQLKPKFVECLEGLGSLGGYEAQTFAVVPTLAINNKNIQFIINILSF